MRSPALLALALAAGAAPLLHADTPVTTQPILVRVGPDYAPRAEIGYDNQSDLFSTGCLVSMDGITHAIDDISFSPGPWAAGGDHLITGFGFGFSVSGSADTSPFYVRYRIWDGVDFAAPDMLGDATLVDEVFIAINDAQQNSTYLYGIGFINFGFEYTGDSPAIEIELIDQQTQVQLPASDGISLVGGYRADGPGSSSADLGRDEDHDGFFTGGPVGLTERRQDTIDGCGPLNLVTFLEGQEGFELCPDLVEPEAIDVTLVDGSQSFSGIAPQDTVVWHRFTLDTPVYFSLGRFLDIDTEGSDGDPVFALFKQDGSFISYNDDDGTGSNAQLTYGIGRRDAADPSDPADSAQYDGRSGELDAGTYYLALAFRGGGGPELGNCFGVFATSPETAYTLNFNSNLDAGALAPAVPPPSEHLGFVPDPGFYIGTGEVTAGAGGVLWRTFEVRNYDCVGYTSPYLDIDWQDSQPADTEAYLFDANGTLIRSNSDDGEGLLPQFSFGNSYAHRSYNDGTETFSGADGPVLPPGLYYIANTVWYSFAGPDRWNVRPFNPDSRPTIAFNIFADCLIDDTADPCGTTDFDGDGDEGTDADIEAFFIVLAGGTCPTGTCGSIDFDGDGDEGTDADIEAFFRKIAGGPC